MNVDKPLIGVKIIKLVNGEDVVTVLPTGKNQLPENSQLVRIEKPLLIKYVPQMTMTGFKDYIALIKWCSYTPDKVITIPKNKIMTITNASAEMISSYVNIAVNYDVKPVPVRQQNYKQQRFTDAQNEKIGDIFDEDFDDEDMDKTIH
jgi:hypothetical protein|tara:strand:- start:8388 stop:8831 length:444 start_codon:yes stop_codon:yes gene_type:complete